MKLKGIDIAKLIVSLLVPLLAGAIGGMFTASSVATWYAALEKPFFSPPNWVFGPVWTTLYILMGISLYLVWSKKGTGKALMAFSAQMALNAFWSAAFFGMQSALAGLIVIVALLACIIITILEFRRVSVLSAWLLAPYLLWVSFATVLNLSIFLLNG